MDSQAVIVRNAKYKVDFGTKGHVWVWGYSKGNIRKVVSCNVAFLPKGGRAREAVARALFPSAT